MGLNYPPGSLVRCAVIKKLNLNPNPHITKVKA